MSTSTNNVLFSGFIATVQSIAELRVFDASKLSFGSTVVVNGNAYAGDHNGGVYSFYPGDTSTDDGLTVVAAADGVAGNYAHATTAKVVARRSSSGSLVRYFLLGTSGGRATGTNAGDASELFGVALSDASGVLTATITPQSGRNFEEVLVLIEARYARP